MMKILRKGAILLVIFVAVVAGTSFLMRKNYSAGYDQKSVF